MKPEFWTNEAIVSDSLGRAPDVQLGSNESGIVFSRWRQFVGTYKVPALPRPFFCVHVAGKPSIRTWLDHAWSDLCSVPGQATIVPAGQPTSWLVDGELDVVTITVHAPQIDAATPLEQLSRLKFAFSDPLGVALTKQILAESYASRSGDRDAYVGILSQALRAHVLRAGVTQPSDEIPSTAYSGHRLHRVMNHILKAPHLDHSIEALAEIAGLSPPHFCRMFKKCTGMTPHQYVTKTRLEHAQRLLEQSDLPVGLVSEQLGFASQSHFSRLFHKFSGQTPSQYRARTLQALQ
jgi:AraC family transcriptional regulator